MQDAFLKKGFGIGRTFAALSPTLRIDYIFADKHFTIKQFKRVVKKLSDHYMLVADVSAEKIGLILKYLQPMMYPADRC